MGKEERYTERRVRQGDGGYTIIEGGRERRKGRSERKKSMRDKHASQTCCSSTCGAGTQ